MHFDLKKLQHALTVQRLRSFSMAADELGLTQPTLSRSISSLEAIWGTRIFERDRAGVIATAIGAEMLQEAAQLLAGARTLNHNMKLRAKAQAGSVTFGMSGLVGEAFMAKTLSSVLLESPNLVMTGKINTGAQLINSIKADEIEFGIFAETQVAEDDSIQFEKVRPIPLSLIVRSAHPLAHMPNIKLEDIARYPFGCSTPSRIFSLPRDPTIVCDNYGIAKDLILKSDAVWLLSPWIVREQIQSGHACELDVDNDHYIRTPSFIFISSKNRRLRSPAADLIISKFKEVISNMDDEPAK